MRSGSRTRSWDAECVTFLKIPIHRISPADNPVVGISSTGFVCAPNVLESWTMQRGINVLALVRGEERYVFLYDDESADQLLRTLGEYAADPELTFSWYDAAVMSQRIARLRDQGAESSEPKPHTTRPRFKEPMT